MVVEMLIEHDVMVPMSDGTKLSTDIYRPGGTGPVPVLLNRTPYGKRGMGGGFGSVLDPLELVQRGIALVRQDSRGCFKSEGTFEPFVSERADGHDTIEWAAAQDWCTGRVGIFGSSYMGVTALQATVDAPDALKACFVYLTSPNYWDSWVYSGGALELGFTLRWTLTQAANAARRLEAVAELVAVNEVVARFDADPTGFMASTFDVASLLGTAGKFAPHWSTWLGHDSYDSYWRSVDVAAAAAEGRVRVPVFHVAGWYDGFLKGHLQLQEALERSDDSRHRFMVGPWDHESYLGMKSMSSAGIRNFGSKAMSGAIGFGGEVLSWFEGWLNDKSPDPERPAVGYFEMGSDTWQQASSWPPAHTLTRWYLHSDGRANTRDGDGRLLPAPAVTSAADSYIYDPASPAPTVGGRHLAYSVPNGVQEQGVLEDRDDVLVYTSERLLEPIAVRGPVTLELRVRSSAATTDFAATLVDVSPSGAAYNVADGMARVSLRPGEIQEVVVDLWDTAYVFARGHRLRVHVTSSNFPRFDRNPNLADDEAGRPPSAVAVQHVLHDGMHPSALVLAVAVDDERSRG